MYKPLLTFLSFSAAFSPLNIALAKERTTTPCKEGEHWVQSHHRSAYLRGDGTSVSATNVAAHCQANPPSYSLWADRIKSAPSKNWLKKKEIPTKWTAEEKERVLEALSELPSTLLARSVTALVRLTKSSAYSQNPASGETGEIALYDLAFSPSNNLTRILAHEFAHETFRQFSDTEKDLYRTTSEWLLVKTPRTDGGLQLIPNRDDDAYVEDDGKESLTEDFSNNIEYFLFEPLTLSRKTPKVFNWIKAKYGDTFKWVKERDK